MSRTDWRSAAALIQERGRVNVNRYVEAEHFGYQELISLPLRWFVKTYFEGDLPECRSPLWFESQAEKLEWLDQALKGGLSVPNGRPRGNQARAAATLALRFYETWRAENDGQGISDFGCRLQMKQIAASAIVEDLHAWRFCEGIHPKFLWEIGEPKSLETFIDTVLDLMNKGKNRIEPERETIIEFFYALSETGPKLPPKPPHI